MRFMTSSSAFLGDALRPTARLLNSPGSLANRGEWDLLSARFRRTAACRGTVSSTRKVKSASVPPALAIPFSDGSSSRKALSSTAQAGFPWNAFVGNRSFDKSSTHSLLHLIQQPHRLALVWNLATGIPLPAINADHLNVVVGGSFSATGLHANVELQIRDIRGKNLLYSRKPEKTLTDYDALPINDDVFGDEAYQGEENQEC